MVLGDGIYRTYRFKIRNSKISRTLAAHENKLYLPHELVESKWKGETEFKNIVLLTSVFAPGAKIRQSTMEALYYSVYLKDHSMMSCPIVDCPLIKGTQGQMTTKSDLIAESPS